jgi:hypothetical protein
VDAPGRRAWHQLASRVGLQAKTFGRTCLSGYRESRFVMVERYLTPPRNLSDIEEGILWTRIVMTVKNAQALSFILGRSSVLDYAGGWFARQFKTATTLSLGSDDPQQSFIVKEAVNGFVQSVLRAHGTTVQALVTNDRTYFVQLEGARLTYTELGTELMDNAAIEKSARQVTLALGFLNAIAELVEARQPELLAAPRNGH